MIKVCIKVGKKRLEFQKEISDFTSQKQAASVLKKIIYGDMTALAFMEVKDDTSVLEAEYILTSSETGEVLNSFKRPLIGFNLPCIIASWSKDSAAKKNPYIVKQAC